jgi:hypothetical protein
MRWAKRDLREVCQSNEDIPQKPTWRFHDPAAHDLGNVRDGRRRFEMPNRHRAARRVNVIGVTDEYSLDHQKRKRQLRIQTADRKAE